MLWKPTNKSVTAAARTYLKNEQGTVLMSPQPAKILKLTPKPQNVRLDYFLFILTIKRARKAPVIKCSCPFFGAYSKLSTPGSYLQFIAC